MNSTPSKLLPIDKHSHLQLQPQSSSASIFNSPTKPLNFPRTNSKPSLDPNSSSDTYTSEQDQEKGKEEKKDTAFQTSFDRNFDLDNSIDIQQTIQHQQQQPQQQQQLSQTDNNLIDEFSFQTPMTSTLDLTKQNPTVDKVNENHAPTYINTSPNKSIMKKATPKVSPKKLHLLQLIPKSIIIQIIELRKKIKVNKKKILLSHPQYNINGKTLLNSIILMKIQMLQFHQHHHFIRRSLLLRNY